MTCARVPGSTISSAVVPLGPETPMATEPTGFGDLRLPCGPAIPLSATAHAAPVALRIASAVAETHCQLTPPCSRAISRSRPSTSHFVGLE